MYFFILNQLLFKNEILGKDVQIHVEFWKKQWIDSLCIFYTK